MALRQLYVAAATTNGTALGEAGQDVLVKKLIIGNPVDAGTVSFYNSAVSVGAATGNIAAKITQPTAAAGKDWVRVVDFGDGLALDGGSVQMVEDQNITVIFEVKN